LREEKLSGENNSARKTGIWTKRKRPLMKMDGKASDTLIFYLFTLFLPSAKCSGMDCIPGLESEEALELYLVVQNIL
jgi:hypothetical protein